MRGEPARNSLEQPVAAARPEHAVGVLGVGGHGGPLLAHRLGDLDVELHGVGDAPDADRPGARRRATTRAARAPSGRSNVSPCHCSVSMLAGQRARDRIGVPASRQLDREHADLGRRPGVDARAERRGEQLRAEARAPERPPGAHVAARSAPSRRRATGARPRRSRSSARPSRRSRPRCRRAAARPRRARRARARAPRSRSTSSKTPGGSHAMCCRTRTRITRRRRPRRGAPPRAAGRPRPGARRPPSSSRCRSRGAARAGRRAACARGRPRRSR